MHIHRYCAAPVGITIRVISVVFVVASMLHGSSFASEEQEAGTGISDWTGRETQIHPLLKLHGLEWLRFPVHFSRPRHVEKK